MKSEQRETPRENRKARVLEESLKYPELGRKELSRRLASEGGPSEATIGKYLREERRSQREQRLVAAGKDQTLNKPGLGEVLYVARLPCEAGDTPARTMLLGFDEASAFAFIADNADSLPGLLEELVAKSAKMLGREPCRVLLDRGGDRYFKIPKAAEDFAKGRGIVLRLEGRWGKNLLAHRRRLEDIWNQLKLSVDGAEVPRERIVDRHNFHEQAPFPPCSGRTPFQTFLDLGGGRVSGSSGLAPGSGQRSGSC